MSNFLHNLIGQPTSQDPPREDRDLESFFTNAETPHRLFQDWVRSAPLPKQLFVLHGVGGAGKSSLLRMYRLYCYQEGIPVALADAQEVASVIDLLSRWSAGLSETGIRLRTFTKDLRRYWTLKAEIQEKRQAASKTVQQALGTLGKVTAVATLRATTGVTAPLASSAAEAIGEAGAELVMGWLGQVLERADRDLYINPAKRLTQDFLADLARASNGQRILLLVDTYEQLTQLDRWMCDVAQRLPEGILLVIAGRAKPDWDRVWAGWRQHAGIVELQEMTNDDIQALVRKYYTHLRDKEPDPDQVQAIAEFARGLPLAAVTVVQLWLDYGLEDFHTIKAQVAADLADRLLEGVPLNMRPVFEAAALLRIFNEDALKALLDDSDANIRFAELRQWPFVYPRGERWTVHDTIRELVNESLRMRAPGSFRKLHHRAADYYRSQLSTVPSTEQERVQLELLHHQLQADEREGVRLLERLFEEARRSWQRDFMEKLLTEAARYTFKEPAHLWHLQHLQAQAALDWRERERRYKALLTKDLEDTLRPGILRDLSQALFFQGKGAEARRYLKEALDISKQLNNPIEVAWTRLAPGWGSADLEAKHDRVSRARQALREAGDTYGEAVAELEMGYYYLSQWQPEEAEAAFRRSRDLHRQLGNSSNAAMAQERMGQAYLIAGDFARAVATKEAALQEFEVLDDEWGIAWTLDELATCYQWTGQWELGLQATERAKQLFTRWGGNRETECTARQGNFYLKQGRLDLALKAYQQAASMPEHGTWSNYHIHAGHGQIHLAQGEFEKARKRFEQAMQSFRERNKDNEAELTGNCNLGNLFMAQGHWEKAIEHFSACLDMATLMRHQAFRCLAQIRMAQAYYQLGYPERFEALVSEIEEVAKRCKYHQLLAEICTLRGHVTFDESSADSQKAVLQYYETALKHALHYNRYQLDETVKEIIAHCQNREAKGRQILTDLVQFWRTCTAQQAHSCLEAERAAREREPGDGSPQINVVERIKRALTA